MWKYLCALFLFVVVILVIGFVRNTYSGRLNNPLHTELQLAANFGELRPDHFHMGLDIRTGGKEDLPVYAIEDGWISRVIIEPGGYGKAIFITHNNGITSLYAHLNRYDEVMEKYIHDQQYKTKSWQQDLSFPSGKLTVMKGQLIAFSGNTGHSEGPHLHFELRDTKTGNNLNPALHGLVVKDHTPPSIIGLYWYDRRYSTYEKGPIAVPAKRKIVKVTSPLISLGIRTEDRIDDSRFRYGIYRTQVWMDDALIHDVSMDNFSDSDSRYVNACIDYSTRITKGQNILHLSRLPGNQLPVFGKMNGLIRLNDNSSHEIKIRVSDIAGNSTDMQFEIQKGSIDTVVRKSNEKLLIPGQTNMINGTNAVVHFRKNSFYDSVFFVLKETAGKNVLAASPRITLHNPTVPVHERYTVSIKSKINDALRKRTVMQFTGFKKKSIVKGIWDGNSMRASFDELGSVQLLSDTIAPEIKFEQAEKKLVIAASDNLGEIADFHAELDGQWILFAQKGNAFTYEFDEYCKPGKHRLFVRVTDVAGNISQQQFSFTAE